MGYSRLGAGTNHAGPSGLTGGMTYVPILYSRSVDPWKLCVGVKYYIAHMYSMPYYTYGSTANFLFLGPTAFRYIYQKNGAVT